MKWHDGCASYAIVREEMNMGEMVRLTVELPKEVVVLTGREEKDLPRALKHLLALELVRQGALTYSKASELLGVGQAEFISFLGEHKVSIFQFSPDEVRHEVAG
jgi:predicted HTH domain antitoxin